MNFRGCMCETKIIFCILGRMDGINVEVSMNPNDQCISCTRSKLYQTEQLTVLATVQTTRVALVKASKNKANPVTDEVCVENRNHGLA